MKEKYGKQFKYKDMCDMMGDEYSESGKIRSLQLNKWRQYYDIEKNKTKYIINKKYNDDEISIIEKSGKYTTYIENMLMETLHEIKGKEKDYVVLTNREILEMAYMVNNKYFEGKNSPHKFVSEFKMRINRADVPNELFIENQIYSNTKVFFSASYRLLKRVVSDSIKSIERKSLISANKTFVLYKNYFDDMGIWNSKRFECRDDDHNRILTVQRKAIEKFNEETPIGDDGKKKYFMKDMYSIGYLYDCERERFNALLNSELEKEFAKEGYNAYANAYRINMASKECFNYVIKQMRYSRLNRNIQEKLLTAKDLTIIETALRQDMIKTFIKN